MLPLQSMFDLISPTQTINGTACQIDRKLGPTFSTLFEQYHGFFYVPLQLMGKDKGGKAAIDCSDHPDGERGLLVHGLQTRARLHKTPVTVTGIRSCTHNLTELHEITYVVHLGISLK